jgi:hypothetical protein
MHEPPPIYEPLKPPVNAAEACLLALCLWSAVNAGMRILNNDLTPVDQLLGRGWAIAWAVGLCGGALIAGLGLIWRGKPITAVALQEIGYATFAVETIARCVALVGLDQYALLLYYVIFVVGTVGRVLQLEIRVRRHRAS